LLRDGGEFLLCTASSCSCRKDDGLATTGHSCGRALRCRGNPHQCGSIREQLTDA
jgi:hypothetical protein